jgi:hypothetical protein
VKNKVIRNYSIPEGIKKGKMDVEHVLFQRGVATGRLSLSGVGLFLTLKVLAERGEIFDFDQLSPDSEIETRGFLKELEELGLINCLIDSEKVKTIYLNDPNKLLL